jgi:hypothetical protein
MNEFQTRYYLKSTKQEVFPMNWSAGSPKPWPNNYERVLIPNNNINRKERATIQVVVKHNILVSKITPKL